VLHTTFTPHLLLHPRLPSLSFLVYTFFPSSLSQCCKWKSKRQYDEGGRLIMFSELVNGYNRTLLPFFTPLCAHIVVITFYDHSRRPFNKKEKKFSFVALPLPLLMMMMMMSDRHFFVCVFRMPREREREGKRKKEIYIKLLSHLSRSLFFSLFELEPLGQEMSILTSRCHDLMLLLY
jgi:hypothetical protein